MLNGDYYGTSRTFYHNVTRMASNYFNFALEPGAASVLAWQKMPTDR